MERGYLLLRHVQLVHQSQVLFLQLAHVLREGFVLILTFNVKTITGVTLVKPNSLRFLAPRVSLRPVSNSN